MLIAAISRAGSARLGPVANLRGGITPPPPSRPPRPPCPLKDPFRPHQASWPVSLLTPARVHVAGGAGGWVDLSSAPVAGGAPPRGRSVGGVPARGRRLVVAVLPPIGPAA
jgi:hypothetical protein